MPNAGAVATLKIGTTRLESRNVEDVAVRAGSGQDAVLGLNGIGALTHLTIDGGDGDDELNGADGADTLLGGDGDDSVDGNRGADDIDLGAGDDVVQSDAGEASDTVDGRSGVDRMDFNGSDAPEVLDLFRNESRSRLTSDDGTTIDGLRQPRGRQAPPRRRRR